ncbi:MAG TPA: helicase C-terminal domain-containing protein [Actinomycetes bacterium]
MPTDRPRSLADDLRTRDDAALQSLLRDRPDLLNPVPSDLAALAARATTRPSVQRALDHLDRFHLQVVEVLCALPDPVDVDDVHRLLGADAADTDRALAALRAQALVYGEPHALVVVRTVRETIGAPAGLGPPAEQALQAYGPARLAQLLADLGLPGTGDPVEAARRVAALLADRPRLDAQLAAAPPGALDALQALAWGPPAGRVERAARDVDAATARSPLDWLLAHGLLVAGDASTVVLPREVGLHLRGGRVHAHPQPVPPDLDLTQRPPEQVDRTAAGAAFTVVRLVEELLELWSTEPPKALRAGGLGVRERARGAAVLDVDEATFALLAEVAHTCGLLAPSADVDEVWLPTPAYDEWRAAEPAARWLTLVSAWLETTRVPGLAGRKDQRDRVLAPLGPDLDRGVAPQVRRAVLAALADAPAGAAATPASLTERLRWAAPRRGGVLRDELVGWTLHEGEVLGLVGRGALAGHGRLLVAGDGPGAAERLATLLPQPLDHVLLQADLTAVAPGPLTTDLAHRLRMVADVESTGGATVYRFGEASVRRALDAGWSAADLLDLFSRHSKTPVPQPLTYLVEDVARRHGKIRVGLASAYVRSDDETTLGEIVADRRAVHLRLRRLAPTVLAAQAPVDVVLDRLREMGYAPAAEGPDGDVVVRRPDSRRATGRHRPPRLVAEPVSPTDALLAAAVRAVRAGDRALTAVRRDGGTAGPVRLDRRPVADILATLQEAVATGQPLWIGYVNAEGQASQRVIEPIGVEGGYVSAYDHHRDEVRTFAVHRITGVSPIAETGS